MNGFIRFPFSGDLDTFRQAPFTGSECVSLKASRTPYYVLAQS